MASFTSSETDLELAQETKTRGELPPEAPPLVFGRTLSRQDHRTLERTNSVSVLNGPAVVEPRVRLPINFRTLSIGVTETRRTGQYHDSGGKKKGKKDVKDLSSLEWHTLSSEEVCTRLGVSPDVGLESAMATRRLAKDGKNVLSPPPTNLPKKIFFYLFGGFGGLLFGASVVCFISWRPLGDPHPQASNLALAVVLLIVMLLQSFFNAWQDYSTGRVMASISGMLPSDVVIFRDGQTVTVPVAHLVAGDIVKVTLGSKIPADLRMLECSSDLKFDRSILTGESKAVSGTVENTDTNFMESRNIALQGTLCTDGSGLGVCVGLGDSTVFGRIAKEATRERPLRTTLEIEISRFVLIIASFAAGVAIIIVILWAAWLRRSYPNFINTPGLLIDLVSVAVAFIPEGLPICVTLSLTVIASSMKKRKILCKSLSTVEALGCVSVICSDKTGTLTQNRMSVVNLSIGEDRFTIDTAQKIFVTDTEEGDSVKVLASIAALCNDATFGDNAPRGTPAEERTILGDATDTGLLRFAEKILSATVLRTHWIEKGKIAFNSKNKYAVKLFQPSIASWAASGADSLLSVADGYSDGGYVLLVKGAPDILFSRCSTYLKPDMTHAPLTASSKAAINQIQTDFASQGQRVLLLCKRTISLTELSEPTLTETTRLEETLTGFTSDLTIVGLVALVDPPRDDTLETVRICRRAGIRFLMVTGDFALTAAAIATQCGIFSNPPEAIKHASDLFTDTKGDIEDAMRSYRDLPEDHPITSLVLSGDELRTLTDAQWSQVLTFDEVVFARTSPQQKLQIVKAYQSDRCTVAVTGDGVNDAPALRQADVGVAVAGGSEVAMEAADLILLDKFSAIVVGIEQGRLCFENLKKTMLYLLPAGSFSELMPVVVNILFGLPQALSNIQMILICTVTDVLPALSLVFEKPEADLLLLKPRDRFKEHLVDPKLICHAYLFLGVLESLTAMTGAFYFGFQNNGVPFSALWLKYGNYDADHDLVARLTSKAQSIYFFNLVLMQWFNLLATRTRRLSLFQQSPIGSTRTRNFYIFPAMAIALSLAIFFSYVPWFQRTFLTSGIAAEYFFLPCAYGVVILFLDEVRKWWIRRSPKSLLAKAAW